MLDLNAIFGDPSEDDSRSPIVRPSVHLAEENDPTDDGPNVHYCPTDEADSVTFNWEDCIATVSLSCCDGFDTWWDAYGRPRCALCDPPYAKAAQLREMARRLRGQSTASWNALPLIGCGFPPRLAQQPPKAILEYDVLCQQCAKVKVLPGVPGKDQGLCYYCWQDKLNSHPG